MDALKRKLATYHGGKNIVGSISYADHPLAAKGQIEYLWDNEDSSSNGAVSNQPTTYKLVLLTVCSQDVWY